MDREGEPEVRKGLRLLFACAIAFACALPASAQEGSGGPLGIGEPRKPEPYTLEQRFLQAAREGDRATLELALARGVAPGTRDDLGRSALLLAVHDAGSLEIARFLHAKGAAVDEPDHGGRAPLSWTAADGHEEIARWLLDLGARADRRDAEGRTPLFYAAAAGHAGIATLLLDRGADPNAADRFGDTTLMLVCARGQDSMAALLLARGADPSLRNQEGRTAADRAAPGASVCRSAGALQSPR